MENKYRNEISEITDAALLSLISGGSAEHDHDKSSSSNGTAGGGTNALHSSWANLQSGVLGSMNISCSLGGNFYSTPLSNGISYGGSANSSNNGSKAGSNNCSNGGVGAQCTK